jgi:ribonuclease P protein component
MKKEHIIKKNTDFNRIINNVKPYKTKLFNIFVERKEPSNYMFGFSVGKKIGNAVVRNKLKRQIKSICQKKEYKNNFNCIIMVKREVLKISFQEMEEEILKAFEVLNILK